MHWFDLIGYIGAVLMFSTFYMKTMIPLRIAGISANVIFIVYSALAGVYPVLLLQSCLLPLNVIRLVQMRRLIRRVGEAARGEFDLSALIPFMNPVRMSRREVLFKRGDTADKLYLIQRGKVRLTNTDIVLGPGELVGEIGILSPHKKRTDSAVCEEDSEMMVIESDRVLQLYFQNPEFGFYLVRLVTHRLLQNLETFARG